MREIIVNEKTGFRITDAFKPVVIRDERGLLFYSTESLTPKVKTFNLAPVGKLFIESGEFVPLPNPVEYKLVKLPVFPQHKFPVHPSEFALRFGDNPDKCTINFANHEILFDNSYKEKPLPIVFFTLYHEYAHQFFIDEHLADQMACNYMLIKGFNPDQIKKAPRNSLSAKQEYRKVNVENRIEESNGFDC